jgi:hypothetical protein
MKRHFFLSLIALMFLSITIPLTAQHRAVTAANARRASYEETTPKSLFPRQGFSLISSIPLYDTKRTFFYAGGSIDSRLSYFDLVFSGDLTNKDVLIRLDYGMNVLYFINEPDSKLCASLGVAGIIGIHAEDWETSSYEWYFKAPSFVAGIKYHFDRYSVTVGWQQDYAIFEKLKDGKEVSQEHLKKGALFLKFCVY